MTIRELMSTKVDSCSPETDLAAAAMIMWRDDCGIVPVVESESNRLVGVITDRDICMAAGTKHQPACNIQVGDVMSRSVVTCRSSDSPRNALARMAEHAVRRLPVVNKDGRLVGMLSIADLIASTASRDPSSKVPANEVISTLRSICRRPQMEGSVPQTIGQDTDLSSAPRHGSLRE